MASVEQSQMSSMIGSTDHSRYEQLISTITALQGDIQKTLARCQALQDENESLKNQHEYVTNELKKTQKRCSEYRTQMVEALSSKMEADEATDIAVEKWRTQLQLRTKELELLKSHIKPPDLDSIRLQIREELELSYRDETSSLQDELEKKRIECVKQTKAIRDLESDLETLKAKYESDKRKWPELRDREVETFRKQVKKIESELLDVKENSEDTSLRRKYYQAYHAEKKIRDAFEELKKEYNALQSCYDNEVSAASRIVESLNQEISILKMDRTLCLRNLDGLSGELNYLKDQCASESNEFIKLKVENESLKLLLQSKNDEIEEQRNKTEVSIENFKSQKEAEVEALNAQISILREKTESFDKQITEVHKQASEKVQEAYVREDELRREMEADMMELETLVSDLRLDHENKIMEMKVSKVLNESSISELQNELRSAKREVDRLGREKDLLLENVGPNFLKLEELQKENSELRNKVVAANESVGTLEWQLAQLEDRLNHSILNHEDFIQLIRFTDLTDNAESEWAQDLRRHERHQQSPRGRNQ